MFSRSIAATVVVAASVLLGAPGSASAGPGDGSISGSVTDEIGNPLQNICGNVDDTWFFNTDAAGNYALSNITPGPHRVEFRDCTGSNTYVRQWYDGAATKADAEAVTVVAGANTALNTVTMAAGVSVSGTITDGSGNPIQGVNVQIYSRDGGPDGWAQSDSNGDYRSEALADGTYIVQFWDTRTPAQYASEYYADTYDRDAATELRLVAANGNSRPGVDAQLADGATVSGTVRDESTSNGVGDICVGAHLGGADWDGVGFARTQSDGTYEISGLPAGDIYVSFEDCATSKRYLNEWYDNAIDLVNATAVHTTTGSTQPSIDAELETGTNVSGTVTDVSGQPLADVSVSIDRVDGGHGGWARTDDSGNYAAIVEPGDYKVRFDDDGNSRAIEYWDDQPSYDLADVLRVPGGSPVTGIDARLEPAAHLSGTVTGPDGSPAASICVIALYGTGDDPAWVDEAVTDAAGDYDLDELPAGPYRVMFRDCNDTGPYLDGFYDGATNSADAQTVELSTGEQRSGIDMRMVAAAQIRGTVTDSSGSPLEDICVQATTTRAIGGMTRTGGDGTYSLKLAGAPDYRIQYVDCGDQEHGDQGGAYQAEWYGGGPDPSSAAEVAVAEGGTVGNVDASLDGATGTGTVHGTVQNVRGEGLAAVVVVYLPTDGVRFQPTDADGTFEVTGVPTGTWAIGYLGQGEDDVADVIPDAPGSDVAFAARWYRDTLLTIPGDGPPDPIAQGATLVTVSAGDDIDASKCLGCDAVVVKPPTVAGDHILVDFDATGLAPLPGSSARAAATLTYRVSCESDSGTSTSASQDSYPVKVSGFTPGAPYVCSARVLSNDLEVADSTTFEVTVGRATPPAPDPDPTPGKDPGPAATNNGAGSPGTPSGPDGSGATASPTPAGSPAKLAYTGAPVAALVAMALFMVLMGAGVVVTAMRLGPAHERRRATS